MHKPVSLKIQSRLLDFMRQVGQSGLTNLAAGVPAPELLPVRDLERAFQRAGREVGPALWAYQTPEGHMPLRRTIAERLARRGAAVRGEDVLVTIGCTQALHLAIAALVKPGDLVACESPCYYNTLEQIEAAGGKALPLPVDPNRGIILSEAERLLKKYRPVCLVVCSSLSNPTGATIPEEDRPKLVRLCKKLNVKIIEDDIYAELIDGPLPPPLRAYDDGSNVVYITSYCKSVSPGLRVGCAIGGKWMESMVEHKCMADLHGSLVSEGTLDAFLRSEACGRHLARLRKTCAQRRELARKAILASFPDGVKVSEPRGGFMLWVELPRKIDLKKLGQQALRQKVSFARGDAFACAVPARSSMRINCARAGEQDLVDGLKKLGQLVKKFP